MAWAGNGGAVVPQAGRRDRIVHRACLETGSGGWPARAGSAGGSSGWPTRAGGARSRAIEREDQHQVADAMATFEQGSGAVDFQAARSARPRRAWSARSWPPHRASMRYRRGRPQADSEPPGRHQPARSTAGRASRAWQRVVAVARAGTPAPSRRQQQGRDAGDAKTKRPGIARPSV